jgi:hypothetical protein
MTPQELKHKIEAIPRPTPSLLDEVPFASEIIEGPESRGQHGNRNAQSQGLDEVYMAH